MKHETTKHHEPAKQEAAKTREAASCSKVKAKRITVKLGSPEESQKLGIGACTIVGVNRAVGEVTFLVCDRSPGFAHHQAVETGETLYRVD